MGGKRIDKEVVDNQKKLAAVLVPRLRQARRDAGLLQKDIAQRVGTTSACVSQWMTGKSLPGTIYIPMLARELKVSTDWLLGLDDADRNSAQSNKERLAKLEMVMDVIKMAVADAESSDED